VEVTSSKKLSREKKRGYSDAEKVAEEPTVVCKDREEKKSENFTREKTKVIRPVREEFRDLTKTARSAVQQVSATTRDAETAGPKGSAPK